MKEYIDRKKSLNIKLQVYLLIFCSAGFVYALLKSKMNSVDYILLSLLGFSLVGYNFFHDHSYRVGWDGRHLFYRDWGLKSLIGNREIRIDVMDMTSLEGRYDGDTSMKRAFYEFDYIDVRAKGMGGKKIWLHPMSLDEFRLKLMLGDICRLKPEIFSQNVLNYMRSDRDM